MTTHKVADFTVVGQTFQLIYFPKVALRCVASNIN